MQLVLCGAPFVLLARECVCSDKLGLAGVGLLGGALAWHRHSLLYGGHCNWHVLATAAAAGRRTAHAKTNAKNRGRPGRGGARIPTSTFIHTHARTTRRRAILYSQALQSPGLRIIPCPSGLGSIPHPVTQNSFFAPPLVAKNSSPTSFRLTFCHFAFVTFAWVAPGACLPVRQQTYLLKYRSGYASVPAPVSCDELIRKTNNQYQRQSRQPRRPKRTREQDKITKVALRWRL